MNNFINQLYQKQVSVLPQFSSVLQKQANILNQYKIKDRESLQNYLKACQIFPKLKYAYPHHYEDASLPEYDLNKWFQALQQIYALHWQGIPLTQAEKQIIHTWNNKEQQDFKQWISFYQQQGNLKYKKAQVLPNSFFNANQLKAQVPGMQSSHGPQIAQTEQINQLSNEEQKALLVKKIQGIVGRLNAAEKLATDPEIRDILSRRLDIDLNRWLTLLHEVKRTIQTAPIKSLSSTLLEDLIIRQANILRKQGKVKTAQELLFFAQTAPPPAANPANITSPPMTDAAVPDPMAPVNAPAENESGRKPIDDFIAALNGEDNDVNNIIDPIPDHLANIKIMAQEVPPHVEPEKQNVDDAFDEALKNITVQDVIDNLESLANLLRNREIPRMMSKIDLMMSQLNISSFFPPLAEASTKALESNQYILTRVDDTLSKLKGVISSPNEINLEDLQGEKDLNDPIHNRLEQERQLEQSLKEKRRKQNRAQELASPPQPPPVAPELNLAQPQIQPQAPAPIA